MPDPELPRWRYLRSPAIPGRGGPDVAALSRLGEEGWELVCFVPDTLEFAPSGTFGYLLFKRRRIQGEAPAGVER